MPRASNGTYTLPVAAFVAGSVIKSADVNSDFSDIATTLTNSLDLRGYSTMTGPFKAASGALATPSITFGSDTTSGFFLNGVGQFSLVTASTLVATFNSDQTVTWAQAQTFSGNVSVGGTLTVTGTATFNGAVSFGASASLPAGNILFTEIADPSTPAATKAYFYTKISPFTGFAAPYIKEERGLVYPVSGVYGQCRLTVSGGNLKLSPYFGNLLTINGIPQVIPDAGITLGIGAAVVATFYYIYAYENSGTMTLEFATTSPTLQTGTGLYQKTGDATRTLVGAAYTDTGPAWADTNGKIYTLSYFNRKNKQSISRLTADRAIVMGGSPAYAEFNTEIRCNFINWSDEQVFSTITGVFSEGASSSLMAIGLATDSATVPDVTTEWSLGAGNDVYSMNLVDTKSSLTENVIHFQTLLGKSGAGVTMTAKGSALASDTPTYLICQIMG